MSKISYKYSNSIDFNKNFSSRPPITPRKFSYSSPRNLMNSDIKDSRPLKFIKNTVDNNPEKNIKLTRFFNILNKQVEDMQSLFFQKFKKEESFPLSEISGQEDKTVLLKNNKEFELSKNFQNDVANWETDINLKSSQNERLKESFQKVFFNKKRSIFSPKDQSPDTINQNRSPSITSPPTSNFLYFLN